MPCKTIALHEEIKKKLDMLKIHPRETYEDVIVKLIESNETKVKGGNK